MSTDGGCTISSRQLSCYCNTCLDCSYEGCENLAYVSEWEEQELQCEDGQQHTVVTRGDISTALESIKNLATKDSIVAIASADKGADYYLLEITGDGPEIFSSEEKDDWGGYIPTGRRNHSWMVS